MQERVPALIFTVQGRQYGLLHHSDTALLPWLQRYTLVAPIPGVPSWMLGLLSVHGTTQPVVDLGAFLGHGVSIPDDNARLVFIERESVCVGFLVEGASGMRYLDQIDQSLVNENEPLVSGRATMNDQPISILDGALLLDSIERDLSPIVGIA